MAINEQNVRVTGGVVGDLATTSYGPRTTNKNTASSRPMSDGKRHLVLQLDGDVQTDALLADADFLNETRQALPKGCFIESAKFYSETGVAALVLGAYDVDSNGSDVNITAGVAVPAGEWVAVRDVDISTTAQTLVGFSGIVAGETATVVVEYMQTVAEGSVDGVLDKAE